MLYGSPISILVLLFHRFCFAIVGTIKAALDFALFGEKKKGFSFLYVIYVCECRELELLSIVKLLMAYD